MDGGADDDGPLHLRYSEEGDPARALAMLETETANLGVDGIDVLRKLLEQELHEQVGFIWSEHSSDNLAQTRWGTLALSSDRALPGAVL